MNSRRMKNSVMKRKMKYVNEANGVDKYNKRRRINTLTLKRTKIKLKGTMAVAGSFYNRLEQSSCSYIVNNIGREKITVYKWMNEIFIPIR